ncbi:hypothetical protein CHUAL_003556 [Chamberlinius hualienensis]
MSAGQYQHDVEILKNIGMTPFVAILKYYGFNITDNLSEKRWHKIINVKIACLNVTIAFVSWFTYSPFVYMTNVTTFNGNAYENDGMFYMWLIMNCGFFALNIQLIVNYLNAKYIRTLVWSLARAIDQIPNQTDKYWCKIIIKLCSWAAITAVICGAIIFGFLMVYSQIDDLTEQYKTDWSGSIVLYGLVLILIVLWAMNILALYILINGLLVTFCLLMCKLIATYTADLNHRSDLLDEIFVWDNSKNKFQSTALSRRCITHRNLSMLVAVSDKIFNFFMLNSLILETSVSIVVLKFIHIKNEAYFINGLLQIGQLIVLALKAFMCATVNDKLKSSLTLRNVPNSIQDLEHCSAEHVNYILYLNEQHINKAELTYGGFFPVRKTFIFTIAGTALTYALVLNGIPSA